jgi:hypothetical protein
MQQMASQHTNAVLMVLSGVEHLETERRYPEAGLCFGHGHWRAYYHCHEAASMHAGEHGHFHLFTDIGDQSWAHVAGLSIDAEGQPLQWFAVNRWVTDGPWLTRDRFFDQLNWISADEEAGLVVNWLTALLQLYREPLYDLLCERDRQIKRLSQACGLEKTQENREIYLLARQSIELQSTLEKQLLAQPGNDHVSAQISNNEQ